MKTFRLSFALTLALLGGPLFVSAQDAAYWRQKAAECRTAAEKNEQLGAKAGGPNSTMGPQYLQAARALRQAAAEYDAKAAGAGGGGSGFTSPNPLQQSQQLKAQQLQTLQNGFTGLFNAMQEREARQERRAAEERENARQEAEEARLQRQRQDQDKFEASRERFGSLSSLLGGGRPARPAFQTAADPLDADWLLASPPRPAGGDNLGAIIDDLLVDTRQLGRAPLDNLPPPKQPGEKGEWRTKSGLSISGTWHNFLMLHADVYASVVTGKNEYGQPIPHIRIYNGSRKTFSFTSKLTGNATAMTVAPGETYQVPISIYRDKVQANTPLVVDMEATYWHETR